ASFSWLTVGRRLGPAPHRLGGDELAQETSPFLGRDAVAEPPDRGRVDQHLGAAGLPGNLVQVFGQPALNTGVAQPTVRHGMTPRDINSCYALGELGFANDNVCPVVGARGCE